MSAQLPIHVTVHGRWSVTFRPEAAWDRDGRWTSVRQTVKAITSTVEYRIPYRLATGILRLEHRWDDSHGEQGGFFYDVRPGVVGLKADQHLLVVGLIFTFESSFHR